MAKRLIENYSKRDRRGLVALPLNGTMATGWLVTLGGHQLFVDWHTGEVWILTAEDMNNIAPTNVTYAILNTSTAGVIPVAPAVAGKRVLIVGLFTDVGGVQEIAIRDTNAVAIFGTLHSDKHASIVLPPSEIGYAVTLPGAGLEISLANSVLTSEVILWRYID